MHYLRRFPGSVLDALAALGVLATTIAHLRAQTIPGIALVNIYSFGAGAGIGDDPIEGLTDEIKVKIVGQ